MGNDMQTLADIVGIVSACLENGRLAFIIRCKDCRWYDEKISFCDNCHLPREQTFFCADGKRKDGDGDA